MKGIRCYKCLLYLFLSLITIQVSLFYKWNWFCLNLEPMRHVYKMCKQHEEGSADGIMCSPVCHSYEIDSLQCNNKHTTKDIVFEGTWGDSKIIFKSASTKDIAVLHWYDNGILKYPSENDFTSAVRSITKTMLNQSVSNEITKRLCVLNQRRHKPITLQQRRIEMDNIWVLLQNNEYLLSVAFWENDVFPQVIGTCGHYVALEYVEPLGNPFSIWYDKDTRLNWNNNVKISVLIMDLLEELENNFKEPLHLCDVKFNDFGLTRKDNGRIKILDLDAVYSKSVISKFIKDIEYCSTDAHCQFLDCRGRCDININKCTSGVSNNNLQIVCEKIFLGWRLSNTVLLPGLLLSRYAPDELVAILRQCANPANENHIPRASANEEIRKLLHGVLLDIEESANIETQEL